MRLLLTGAAARLPLFMSTLCYHGGGEGSVRESGCAYTTGRNRTVFAQSPANIVIR